MSIKKEDKLALERYLEKLSQIQQFSQVNLNESDKEKKLRIARAKKDYAFFVKYYFPHYATSDCADFHVEAARYILKHKNCVDVEAWFRGAAKSTHLDIMVPFWLWLNNELDVMLLIGKSADDAKVLLSDLQAEFEANPQILADFGEQKSIGGWEEGNFVTKNGVAFYSLGRGQSPRGVRYRNKRPNYIVLDDMEDDELIRNPKRVKRLINWVFGALFNTMDNKGARLVVANNIIGNDTVVSNIIKRAKSLKEGGRVNIINAIDEEGNPSWNKYSIEFFEERKKIIGDFAFQTEFMNNPQIEGEIFKDEQIQFAPLPRIDSFACIVGHWDVAYAGTSSGDYNAIKVWGLHDEKFYCIKAFVKQCKMDTAMRWMIDFEKSLPTNVIIHWRFESQFWNDALKMIKTEVETQTGAKLNLTQTERPVKNKFDRIVTMQPYYQNGKIYYSKKEEFNIDMQTGINQLKGIEPGYNSHDDSPDADEGAISYLSKFIKSNNPLPMLGDRVNARNAW